LIYVYCSPHTWHQNKKNIFRTKITKFFFKKEFVAAFYVVAFFLKSINQPSNDCKKEWFLSFCQSFQIKKAVLGTTNDTT